MRATTQHRPHLARLIANSPMKELLVPTLAAAVARAHAGGELKSPTAMIAIEAPKDPAHGDAASNVALALARAEGKQPRAIAEIIRRHVQLPAEITEVTVASPGFINFRMAPEYWHRELRQAAAQGVAFVCPQIGNGKRAQVEFLSANPTGPLTVGHGRNAVLGDTLARLFEATGHVVTREYYFNDGGRQMKLLGESVRARYLNEFGRDTPLPEDGYQGEYIREIARKLADQQGPALIDTTDLEIFVKAAVSEIFAGINQTCQALDIKFDVFTNELDLMRPRDGESVSRVDAVMAALRERRLVITHDAAEWLVGEKLGLPKDQVLIRSTGEPTYRTPDIAYHVDKLEHGFDLIIDVFGADHIAEHVGVIAAVKALGYDTTPIRAIIYQFVTLTRGGEKVKMSTRKATYVTLDELIEEVGRDVVRFFFLFRKHDSHLDFDLDLAKRQAPENPVFYVQYAHARLASIFREAEKAGIALPADAAAIDLARLGPEEIDLAKRVVALPEFVAGAVEALEPHRIPFYLVELAGEFHRYYNKPANRIINPDDLALSTVRLFLMGVLRNAFAGAMSLLGVRAPDRM
jgi:arginyl-tRNA synthetase